MTHQDKIVSLAIVIGGPFVASASIEFLPGWLWAPIVLLTLIFWVGTLKQIADYVSNKEQS